MRLHVFNFSKLCMNMKLEKVRCAKAFTAHQEHRQQLQTDLINFTAYNKPTGVTLLSCSKQSL